MLFYRLEILFLSLKCILVLMLISIVCAGYAYYVDLKRSDDDPKKRNYPALAVILAPITAPAVLVLSISIFVLRVLTYGVFMVLFILALIFLRKPFILEALRKFATTIGNGLMEANTILVRLLFSPWIDEPERI